MDVRRVGAVEPRLGALGRLVRFWTDVVKSSFPAEDGRTAVNARVNNGVLSIDVESAESFGDVSSAVARVSTPAGQSIEVTLGRAGPNRFTGEIEASDAGTYAVAASVTDGAGATSFGGSALASLSYSSEYRTGAADREGLLALSSETLGRGAIEPSAAFEAAGLVAGRKRINLTPWLVLAAAYPRDHSIGATSSMSSKQWRGGSGTSLLAAVIRTSVPQIVQRNWILTLRSSPGGGGSGSGWAIARKNVRPIHAIAPMTRSAMIMRTTNPNIAEQSAQLALE